ncbi:glycosyltransferase family 39 protein [Maridesulfovibrio sp.]|uniref:ArnT family glycosyltransferase n=1 Tax=Maridesulfovibrio sp. TaxID=2795000 RepID=UPI002AA80768|nr:glycosyltransferase family 39 protein [Maridesulfovibrio sp.]
MTDIKRHFPAALLFILFLVFISQLPLDTIFQMDTHDEGYNLIKAQLLGEGHLIYSEIWSDQPPLYTWILQHLFSFAGHSVYWVRLSSVFFYSILLAAIYYIGCRLAEGWKGAVCGLTSCITFVFCAYSLQLSFCVLVGLPCLMFGALSMALLLGASPQTKAWRIALSGLLLAASLQVKLITLPLGLIGGIWLLWKPFSLRNLCIWGGSIALGYVLIWIPFWPGFDTYCNMLLFPHWNQDLGLLVSREESFRFILELLRKDVLVLVLAFFGLDMIYRKKEKLTLQITVWFVLAALFHLSHNPFWIHHYPFFFLPVSLLAGVGMVGIVERMLAASKDQKSVFKQSAAVLTVCGLFYVNSCVDRVEAMDKWISKALPNSKIVFIMDRMQRERAKYSHQPLLVTDQQMYAFLFDYTVPPNLAVTSFKRRASGLLNDSDILRSIRELKPEAVLLREVPLKKLEEDSFLRENYSRVDEASLYLFFRK